MQRVCFLLQLKKDRIEEYRKAHQVWPEMLDAMHAAGIRNYSMFIRKDGMLVGYFEAENPEQALQALGKTEVNRRWQEYMAPFFDSGTGDLEKGGTEWLEQYFHMD